MVNNNDDRSVKIAVTCMALGFFSGAAAGTGHPDVALFSFVVGVLNAYSERNLMRIAANIFFVPLMAFMAYVPFARAHQVLSESAESGESFTPGLS